MISERVLIKTLDLLTAPTVAPSDLGFGLEALGPGGKKRVGHGRSIIDQDNVVAVGISEKVSEEKRTGVLAVTFYVDKKKAKSKLKGDEMIPQALALDVNAPPVPTDVVPVGQPRLEAAAWVKRKPIEPANSIGHFQVTAGTLGAIVSKKGKLYLLSNSHVLAQSGTATKGDKILYPGQADDGVLPNDQIGELEEFIQFTIGGNFVNRVDCAIAVPLPERIADIVSPIRKLGLPTGTLKAKRGMKVTKAGRTTQVTDGEVKDVNFRMAIKYPNGVGVVGFLDQVFCTRYTDNGDSGALVLEKESRKAVGLHFAGYPDEHGVKGSVFNPIQEVLNALKIKLVTKALSST